MPNANLIEMQTIFTCFMQTGQPRRKFIVDNWIAVYHGDVSANEWMCACAVCAKLTMSVRIWHCGDIEHCHSICTEINKQLAWLWKLFRLSPIVASPGSSSHPKSTATLESNYRISLSIRETRRFCDKYAAMNTAIFPKSWRIHQQKTETFCLAASQLSKARISFNKL